MPPIHVVSAPQWRNSLPQGLPETIGRYRVLSPLGQGGMGRVVLARDEENGRQVALKLFEGGDDESRYMFERAAKAHATLADQHIVKVYDHGGGEQPYLACELVEGPTLRTLLDQRGTALSALEAANIGFALAQALEHAHSKGVVHRDLKPENVFCATNGRVLLSDFGLAKVMGQHATLATNLYGSPAYMAPEQFAGKPADARSDLHALGATLFEMLTGSPPYDGASLVEIEANILAGKRRALPDGIAPEPFVRLVDQLLLTDPKERPAHARAVAERLRHILDGFQPEAVTRLTHEFAEKKAVPANYWRLWPVALIAMAVGGLVFYFQRPSAIADRKPVSVVVYFDGTAELSIDGESVGTQREPFRTELRPGRHVIEARVYDGPRLRKEVMLVGDEAQIDLP